MQNSDHPCNDVAKGERLLKDTYEALRNGPGWEKTMLAVLYDDAGGTYDHVVPPSEGVPNDASPCNVGNIPAGPPPPPLEAGSNGPARLLTDAEFEEAKSGRGPAMAPPRRKHNATTAVDQDVPWHVTGRRSMEAKVGGHLPDLDGEVRKMLVTYDNMNTFVGFAFTDAPPGHVGGTGCSAGTPDPYNHCAAWMRVAYPSVADAM